MAKTLSTSKEEVSAHLGNITRSEINKNADYDLEQWIQARVKIERGNTVLDIGCGNGKQVVVFSDLVGDRGRVVGADIFSQVPGLLESAKEKLSGKKNVEFLDHSASQPFPHADGFFDAITSCYSFYYVNDVKATLRECYRLLKHKGRCFIVGPSWDNSKEFYDLNREITHQELPANFSARLWRINNEVIPAGYEIFDRVEVSPFVNRVFFEGQQGVKAVEEYYRATLLFQEESGQEDEREQFAREFVRRVQAEIQANGRYIIYKRAIGLTLYKETRP
ncbi:MAG: class I SAM-dependent methyltransferase [Nitrospira sp.]|nr:class I SAM-dependent methyltransferase [Nitrospira sp.]MCA9464409.1 class I SAM-dependent methyltransferase [Nitrospira sp.]MDR4488260.1 class I SAM-dependent methyltransferase [Nitrospirales bacterium]HQU27612.1 class I SAM-dependent methyltransferase [Nitrospirales bacterium]